MLCHEICFRTAPGSCAAGRWWQTGRPGGRARTHVTATAPGMCRVCWGQWPAAGPLAGMEAGASAAQPASRRYPCSYFNLLTHPQPQGLGSVSLKRLVMIPQASQARKGESEAHAATVQQKGMAASYPDPRLRCPICLIPVLMPSEQATEPQVCSQL